MWGVLGNVDVKRPKKVWKAGITRAKPLGYNSFLKIMRLIYFVSSDKIKPINGD